MKDLSVEEALEVLTSKTGKRNRFNKKNFNMLMIALLNDPDFEEEVSSYRSGNLKLKKIMPTKAFRKGCKALLDQAGMDKKDASIVLDKNFKFENVNGLYEFFASAVYMYMQAGNKFSFLNKEDFAGSIYLKDVDESDKVSKQYSPKTREYLGEYKVHKKKHKVLASDSRCPKYLKERKKI